MSKVTLTRCDKYLFSLERYSRTRAWFSLEVATTIRPVPSDQEANEFGTLEMMLLTVLRMDSRTSMTPLVLMFVADWEVMLTPPSLPPPLPDPPAEMEKVCLPGVVAI